MRDFQAVISKREASITEEEAINLAKRPKDVPLLEKGKYVPDQAIVQGAAQNPILAASNHTSQLKLPKMVVDHLQAKKAELEKAELQMKRQKQNNETPKALNRILSQYNSAQQSRVFARDASSSKISIPNKSAPNRKNVLK